LFFVIGQGILKTGRAGPKDEDLRYSKDDAGDERKSPALLAGGHDKAGRYNGSAGRADINRNERGLKCGYLTSIAGRR
jgi:hypothetical protein